MNSAKILSFLFIILLTFGCVVNDVETTVGNNVNTNAINANNDTTNNSYNNEVQTNNLQTIFCQMPQTYKFAYDEIYVKENITMKRYMEKNSSNYRYYERLSTLPLGEGSWTIATEDSVITYTNSEGSCSAIQHDLTKTNNPFTQDPAIYYLDEFTGETKLIQNSMTGWKMNTNNNLAEELNTKIVTIGDYINKEYCVPLTQEIVGSEFFNYSEKTNFSKEFPSELLDIPVECRTVIPQSYS